MTMKKFLMVFLAILLAIVVVESDTAGEGADFDMFTILYQKIVDVVTPSQNDAQSSGTPKAVLLTENPGRAINRNDYDPDVWARNDFRDRQPSAVAAALVNRAPRYWDTTFVDSGSTISGIWGHLMHQYTVPSFESEAQKEKVAEAKWQLFNTSVTSAFLDALNEYEADYTASLNSRSSCLSAQGGEICSQLLVIDELRLTVSWMNMEVRRRDLHAAQSAVLALQVQDLTTIFADGLRKFERQKRIDVGAVGFGTEFYQTHFEPSDWWRWWSPSFEQGDVVIPNGVDEMDYEWSDLLDDKGRAVDVLIGSDTCNITGVISPPEGAQLDDFDCQVGFKIVPNSEFSGFDSFSFVTSSGTIITISVNIGGLTPGSAGSAFSKVTYTTSESTSASETSTTSFTTTTRTSARSRWWRYRWYGSAGGTSSFSEQKSSEWGSDESTTISFEIAKVSIQRPWLDISLLAFKPVAIRGLTQYQWSTGTGRPDSTTSSRFPLLPTDIVISRNIQISTSKNSWSETETSMETATKYRANAGFNIGFWGFGYRAQTSGRNAYQSASFDSTTSATTSTLIIDGPQIMGWVCTPIPKFPTANSDYVEKLVYGEVITPYTLVETDQVA